MGHGTEDNFIAAIKNNEFKRNPTQEHDLCDRASTNASDPIRTLQLSALR